MNRNDRAEALLSQCQAELHRQSRLPQIRKDDGRAKRIASHLAMPAQHHVGGSVHRGLTLAEALSKIQLPD